jgi:hypothetical protein
VLGSAAANRTVAGQVLAHDAMSPEGTQVDLNAYWDNLMEQGRRLQPDSQGVVGGFERTQSTIEEANTEFQLSLLSMSPQDHLEAIRAREGGL